VSDLKQPHEEPDGEHVEDLELADHDADKVRGGDTVLLSNVVKSQQDVAKSVTSNMK
jgi:hypothetical protein